LCAELNDRQTFACVTAERAFLAAMGGGCQSPVAAFALARGPRLWLRAVSFQAVPPRHASGMRPLNKAAQLGEETAAKLKV
jgi:hydroxymethylbilane synthase